VITAAIITAIATVITALGGALLAVQQYRTRQAAERAEAAAALAAAKADEVHTMVNQQRTDAQRYTATRVAAMRLAGIEVPEDQSLAVTVAPPPAPVE
jgi:hypothetical protein